jgi:hypothetical protein
VKLGCRADVPVVGLLRATPQPPNFEVSQIITARTATTVTTPHTKMDLHEVQNATVRFLNDANAYLERIPGSSIAVRYIKSSYQNDPVRSAVELFLFLFAVRYLLAPKYSTQKKVHLTDAVCSARETAKRGQVC